MFYFVFVVSTHISSDLKNDLEEQITPLMQRKVIEWRHDIHQYYRELSNREFRTAKKVEDHLLSLGIEVETGIAYTGVKLGSIKGSYARTNNMPRADMDALPVIEKQD